MVFMPAYGVIYHLDQIFTNQKRGLHVSQINQPHRTESIMPKTDIHSLLLEPVSFDLVGLPAPRQEEYFDGILRFARVWVGPHSA